MLLTLIVRIVDRGSYKDEARLNEILTLTLIQIPFHMVHGAAWLRAADVPAVSDILRVSFLGPSA
jgi:hypothetical protein